MPRTPKKPNSASNLSDAAPRFRILANETRLQILCALAKGSLDAGLMTTLTGMSQSAVGYHLSLLRASKFVEITRDGAAIIYALTDLGRTFCSAVEKMLS